MWKLRRPGSLPADARVSAPRPPRPIKQHRGCAGPPDHTPDAYAERGAERKPACDLTGELAGWVRAHGHGPVDASVRKLAGLSGASGATGAAAATAAVTAERCTSPAQSPPAWSPCLIGNDVWRLLCPGSLPTSPAAASSAWSHTAPDPATISQAQLRRIAHCRSGVCSLP